MKKLYYIEEEGFLRKLVEALCQSDGSIESHTTDDGQDNLYFFNDLKPDFILVDWSTVKSYEAKLLADLGEVVHIPVGITKLESDKLPEGWSTRATIILDKPLEAKSLLKKIFS